MADSRAVVGGLDVHKASVAIAAVKGDELVGESVVGAAHRTVEAELARLGVTSCCYEAGPTGFGLARHLNDSGIRCEVVAPGLVPVKPGDRIKTDRRDARRLAGLFAHGMLTPVWIPPIELEATRDLIRAREAARADRMRARQRMSKFCLRQGREMPTKYWGTTRRAWLGTQHFEYPDTQIAFDEYLTALDLVDARIMRLEAEIERAAREGPFAGLVAKLRCLRGVDSLTALGIACEVGDFTRFATASQFVAYTGLVPSEHSSGQSIRRSSITKAGNTHLRRLLVEAAWNARRRPATSSALKVRQSGADPKVIERAWRAQQRLYRRWTRMAGRGKHNNKIAVAVARELAGFIWAIATDQPL